MATTVFLSSNIASPRRLTLRLLSGCGFSNLGATGGDKFKGLGFKGLGFRVSGSGFRV